MTALPALQVVRAALEQVDGYLRYWGAHNHAQAHDHQIARDKVEAALAALDSLAPPTDALDLIRDLRSYTHEWDWKYGKEWDAEIAALEAGAEPPKTPPIPMTLSRQDMITALRLGAVSEGGTVEFTPQAAAWLAEQLASGWALPAEAPPTEGALTGIDECIRVVRLRASASPSPPHHAAYRQALADVLVELEALRERGGKRAVSEVMAPTGGALLPNNTPECKQCGGGRTTWPCECPPEAPQPSPAYVEALEGVFSALTERMSHTRGCPFGCGLDGDPCDSLCAALAAVEKARAGKPVTRDDGLGPDTPPPTKEPQP